MSMLFLLNATQMDKLQKLQNRTRCIILNKKFDTNIRSMLNELNWLNVRQIVTFHTLKFIHNMKLGKCSEYLNGKLQRNSEIHNYDTRTKNNYRLPYIRTTRDINCLEYNGIRKYNELPSRIKDCKNMILFKKLLTEYCKNN